MCGLPAGYVIARGVFHNPVVLFLTIFSPLLLWLNRPNPLRPPNPPRGRRRLQFLSGAHLIPHSSSFFPALSTTFSVNVPFFYVFPYISQSWTLKVQRRRICGSGLSPIRLCCGKNLTLSGFFGGLCCLCAFFGKYDSDKVGLREWRV